MLDFIGVGFGPSNLALAVAAREIEPSTKGLFFERHPTFRWHGGMVMEGAVMQISFLKDLATLRNPASPYTFLQYAKAKGRLERFVNLRDFYPTRLEYQDYLAWVAAAFADQVRYGVTVIRVSPVTRRGEATPWCFRVDARQGATGETTTHFARNVVYAAGGSPRIPSGVSCDGSQIVHSSDFLPSFSLTFANTAQSYDFAVVGDGQSAGEIVAYLLERYASATVRLLIPGCALRATDDNPFVNEQFYAESLDAFYHSDARKRATTLRQLRDTNYGVVEAALLERIYRASYLDEVMNRRRLFVEPCSQLAGIKKSQGRPELAVRDSVDGSERTISCDGVVLATGYKRCLDAEIFADVLPYFERDAAGEISLSRHYRLRTTRDIGCGLYLQGFGENLFGPSETLLSVLPFRAEEILKDMLDHSGVVSTQIPAPKVAQIGYPPKQHIEQSLEKLYGVMERFGYATLVSAREADEPFVTHLPLVLDRTRGPKGVLFGHMDRANPQADLLDGRRVVVIFHGPNAYISPQVYVSDQLPTWNSINVHVSGKARAVSDERSLVAGLCTIAERSDVRPAAFRLNPDDPRIAQLIGNIVGFEIEIEEIVGRFKLSQDRADRDRHRAALALAESTERGQRDFIEYIVGLPLTAGHDQAGHALVPATRERRAL